MAAGPPRGRPGRPRPPGPSRAGPWSPRESRSPSPGWRGTTSTRSTAGRRPARTIPARRLTPPLSREPPFTPGRGDSRRSPTTPWCQPTALCRRSPRRSASRTSGTPRACGAGPRVHPHVTNRSDGRPGPLVVHRCPAGHARRRHPHPAARRPLPLRPVDLPRHRTSVRARRRADSGAGASAQVRARPSVPSTQPGPGELRPGDMRPGVEAGPPRPPERCPSRARSDAQAPLLVGGAGAGPELELRAVGGAEGGGVQAQPRLHAGDRAVGVDVPLLVGLAVAVPDDRGGAVAGAAAATRRGTCCRTPSAACPRCTSSAGWSGRGSPTAGLRAVGGHRARHVHAPAGLAADDRDVLLRAARRGRRRCRVGVSARTGTARRSPTPPAWSTTSRPARSRRRSRPRRWGRAGVEGAPHHGVPGPAAGVVRDDVRQAALRRLRRVLGVQPLFRTNRSRSDRPCEMLSTVSRRPWMPM